MTVRPRAKHHRYKSGENPNTEDDPLFCSEEVDRIIKSLNDKGAPELAGISANIARNVHMSCPTLLLSILNKCLKLSTFPDCWKVANVKIIPKQHWQERFTASAY